MQNLDNQNFTNQNESKTNQALIKISLENARIEQGWKQALAKDFQAAYFAKIKAELLKAKAVYTVYPPSSLIFNAFNLTPFDKLKVVILGQDPYHGPNQAMGLSFSVPKGVKIPPSLLNIFKELQSDLGIDISTFSGDLTPWAKQGVLLLNASLSVNAAQPNSHSTFGWHMFSDAVIKTISEQKEHVVFMLWGNYARSKAILIDGTKHLILQAAHPSPLARGAYFGSKHFSKCNDYLSAHGIAPVQWDLNKS